MSTNLSPTVLTRQALLRLARLQLEILDSLDHLNRSDDRERIAGDKHFPLRDERRVLPFLVLFKSFKIGQSLRSL